MPDLPVGLPTYSCPGGKAEILKKTAYVLFYCNEMEIYLWY